MTSLINTEGVEQIICEMYAWCIAAVPKNDKEDKFVKNILTLCNIIEGKVGSIGSIREQLDVLTGDLWPQNETTRELAKILETTEKL